MGIRLSAAAEALVTGQTSTIGIDDSPAALSRCNGEPEAVLFEGPFPQGTQVCADCNAAGDAITACVAKCEQLARDELTPLPPDLEAVCKPRTRVSTNGTESTNACYDQACGDDLMVVPGFQDSRTKSEEVVWGDLVGVFASGNSLTKTSPTPADPQTFDGGAASTETIEKGDGFIEFRALEGDTARLCGLSNGAPPDTDPSFHDISFAIDLFKDGRFYVFERGAKIGGPDVNQSFGAYTFGEIFRIHFKDNFNGTATISYNTLPGICLSGMPCAENAPFYTSTAIAAYPLRVDASFREKDGRLADVRIVRIR
jgi:hypothetical protein